MKSQVYRLYHIYHNDGASEERLVARFMVQDKEFKVLEDHDDVLKNTLVDGPFDATHQKLLHQLAQSGYYKLMTEDEVNQGHHEDLIPELDIGPTEPDAEYLLSTQNHEAPQRLEMYGQNAIMGGRKLTDEEFKELMARVRSGQFQLVPI